MLLFVTFYVYNKFPVSGIISLKSFKTIFRNIIKVNVLEPEISCSYCSNCYSSTDTGTKLSPIHPYTLSLYTSFYYLNRCQFPPLTCNHTSVAAPCTSCMMAVQSMAQLWTRYPCKVCMTTISCTLSNYV